MNIVLLVFGNDIVYHAQAYFCILSLLKYRGKEDTISLYTDNPRYYNRYKEYINVIEVPSFLIKKWENGTGYIFRVKIKAIEDSAQRHPDSHLLFIDCDTVVYNKIDSIKEILDKGNGIMYNDEGHPSKMKGASLRMWKALEGQQIGSCTISQRHNVWNSGVIGIPKDKLTDVIHLALTVCDTILKTDVDCFTAEQYAFSIAMQEECELLPAEDWVIHYWGNKDEWTSLAMTFICNSFLCDRRVDDEIKALNNIEIDDVPLRVKKSHTMQQLVKLINRLFPDKVE